MTITEFLLARIAEDEAVARAALDDQRSVPAGATIFHVSALELTSRYNPARVLAECAGKRAVVRRYESFYATRRANWTNPNYQGAMEELGFVLQRMADAYADDSDYRQEWAL